MGVCYFFLARIFVKITRNVLFNFCCTVGQLNCPIISSPILSESERKLTLNFLWRKEKKKSRECALQNPERYGHDLSVEKQLELRARGIENARRCFGMDISERKSRIRRGSVRAKYHSPGRCTKIFRESGQSGL